VELPYDGHEMSMVILLPENDQFEDFEVSLDADLVETIITDLNYTDVALTMPKFEFELEFSLADALVAMGMSDAFSSAADFSGMTGNRDLVISDVLHKAFVSVDEEGTEAAAATAAFIALASLPPFTAEVTLDHPFIFLIRDIETGTVLFIGRIENPSI